MVGRALCYTNLLYTYTFVALIKPFSGILVTVAPGVKDGTAVRLDV